MESVANPGLVAPRPITEQARTTQQAFQQLEQYCTPRQLRQALGWSAVTLRQWQQLPPTRPRSRNRHIIFAMVHVAQAAARWVTDSQQIGEWLLIRQPQLYDQSPAEIIRTHQQAGAELLVEQLVQIAPRQPATPGSAQISLAVLRATLTMLGIRPLPPAPPVGKADLSDFN